MALNVLKTYVNPKLFEVLYLTYPLKFLWGFILTNPARKSPTPFGVGLFLRMGIWRADSNNLMQQSGGLLLDAGSTASTP